MENVERNVEIENVMDIKLNIRKKEDLNIVKLYHSENEIASGVGKTKKKEKRLQNV